MRKRVIAALLCLLPVMMTGCAVDNEAVQEVIAPVQTSIISESADPLPDDSADGQEAEASQEAEAVSPETTPAEPEQIQTEEAAQTPYIAEGTPFRLEDVQEYSGEPYAVVNDDIPYFTQYEITDVSFENYSELDILGRCGVCTASLSVDTMPAEGEERGEIGQVKPSGWHTVKYDCVAGNYLFNRCHLIGWQLGNENANINNLITGTRYLNLEMLEYENDVADYIRKTQNHVMYRVTPIFAEGELVCRGLLMEGYSVEDAGDGIQYCVFFYNVQPGVEIDYATGESEYTGVFLDKDSVAVEYEEEPVQTEEAAPVTEVSTGTQYVLNNNTMKFHEPDCSSVDTIKEKNREDYTGNREDLIAKGYSPCGKCKP